MVILALLVMVRVVVAAETDAAFNNPMQAKHCSHICGERCLRNGLVPCCASSVLLFMLGVHFPARISSVAYKV